MEGLWEIRYIPVWRSVLLVVHKLLKDEEEDLGNVFQEFEFLMYCHWRSGNLFQGVPSQCVGISRNSVVFCPTATWHSVGIGARQQRDCLQCGIMEVQHIKRRSCSLLRHGVRVEVGNDRSVKMIVKTGNNTKQQPQQSRFWGTELSPSYIDVRTEFFFRRRVCLRRVKNGKKGGTLVDVPVRTHHLCHSCTLSEGRARR